MKIPRVSITPLLLIAATLTPPGHAADDDPLSAARRPIALDDGKLTGSGATWLREQAAAAGFFMLGEQHATADIAEWATALYAHVADLGYHHAAVEVGPWSTPVMEQLLRQPDRAFERSLTGGRHLTFPFFFFAEEAAFGRAVIARSPATSGALWGVDQEFIAAAPPVLDLLAGWARTDAERDAVDTAMEQAAANPMLLGAGADSDWQALVDAFDKDGHPEARQLLEDVLLSRRVYAPFVGRGGQIQPANELRERYMKRNFQKQLERAAAASGTTPRVFLKFGANHVAYGYSPTHVLTLGTFAREIGLARGIETFNLHIDCKGGEMRDPRSGATSPCNSYFLEDGSLAAYLDDDRPTLIDLKSLRPQTKVWKEFDEKSRALILRFDAYLVLPNVRPATPISGGGGTPAAGTN